MAHFFLSIDLHGRPTRPDALREWLVGQGWTQQPGDQRLPRATYHGQFAGSPETLQREISRHVETERWSERTATVAVVQTVPGGWSVEAGEPEEHDPMRPALAAVGLIDPE